MSTQGIEALYPFLYNDDDVAETLVDELTESAHFKLSMAARLRHEAINENAGAIWRCAAAVAERLERGGRLYVFGNGVSATDAAAIAHLFTDPPYGRPLPAQSLPQDVATLTALSNDVGFDVVFALQLAELAGKNDVALAISTGGNSLNLIRALEQAREIEMLTVGFSGYDGGRMAQGSLVDHLIVVPCESVQRIQEVQTTLYQLLWEAVQQTVRHR